MIQDWLQGESTRGTIRLPGGRTLSFAEFGDRHGAPVLHFHGGMSSRWEGALYHEAAMRRGVRLISVDRPGIGRSSPDGGRSVAERVTDIGLLVDALSLRRFGVLGFSAGTAYALGCASLMPGRVSAVSILVGVAPVSRPEVRAQLGAGVRVLYRALGVHSWPLAVALFAPSLLLSGSTARGCIQGWARALGGLIGGLSAADQRALTHPTLQLLLNHGPDEAFAAPYIDRGLGAANDIHAVCSDWGFSISSDAPVHLWYGSDDAVTPVAMGCWLAGVLPRATLHVQPGHGHISMIFEGGEPALQALAAVSSDARLAAPRLALVESVIGAARPDVAAGRLVRHGFEHSHALSEHRAEQGRGMRR